ncbi:MAG: glycosyltransferase [Patescibacteria group bacterium]|jgi:glycosyltransferase involved in cell wall biosynthesis
MKIAIINNLYKPYHKGGAEKVCERLITELEKNGHFCFIVTTKPKILTDTNQNPKTYYLDSNYYNLGKKSLPYRFFWQIGNIFNFGQGKKLKKILQLEKPDLIISNNLMGIGLKTFQIIKKLNIKHTHILHDIQLIHPSGLIIFKQEKIINTLPSKIYQNISRYFSGSPEKVVSPSNWLLQEHIKKGFFKKSEKIVQPNPQPFGEKKEIIREKNKNTTDFLFIGQIEEHKGIIFLIETFKKIENAKINLKIIGDGKLIDKIKLIAQDDNRIKILGLKNKEDVTKELIEADCLIVPSLCYENSPTVIYEAQHFNLPIIASNIGGIPELLLKEPNSLFKPGNGKELIERINKFAPK